jgi:hypothetical protein
MADIAPPRRSFPNFFCKLRTIALEHHMFMGRLHKRVGFVAAGLALALGGYQLGRVHADGGPTSQPLWYAGTVADQDGNPLEGNHAVSLRLFESQTGGEAQCVVGPVDASFQQGRFRIDASACLEKIQSRGDLFTELSVDDATKPFARAKIGAVPYAIEANNAQKAESAASLSGPQATELSATSAIAKALDDRLSNSAAVLDEVNAAMAAPGARIDLGYHVTSNCSKVTSSQGAAIFFFDCTCAEGEVALSGRTFSGLGNVIAESGPVPEGDKYLSPGVHASRVWRSACSNSSGARVECPMVGAVCVRAQ